MFITERIQLDAKAEAEAIVTSAEAAAKKRVEDAKIVHQQESEAQIERGMAKAVAEAKQAEIASKILARKQELEARQVAIDAVFIEAGKKLKDAKLADTLKKKFAKTGDKITPAKEGGIIIENTNYTLSLTLPELLASLREDIEMEVAKKLF
ncbi:MAG: hypothetical protein FWE31_03780 [Firmicutes bacterium]|nr:hypothetical protein [Bacillota bacterium]